MKRDYPAALLAVLVLAAAPLPAATIALTGWSGGAPAYAGSDQLHGWTFLLSAPVEVAALGVFDQNSDGLSDSHSVGIFSSATGSLLVSADLPAGIAATLTGQFRYVPVSPLTLAPGAYAIVMTVPVGSEDSQIASADSASTSAPVSYGTSAFGGSASLAYPTIIGKHSVGFFGPNFQFTTAAEVPEPASFLPAAAALALFALRRRR